MLYFEPSKKNREKRQQGNLAFFLEHSVFLTTFATVGHRDGRRHQPSRINKKGRPQRATLSFSLREDRPVSFTRCKSTHIF
jgi:hypothetical protein